MEEKRMKTLMASNVDETELAKYPTSFPSLTPNTNVPDTKGTGAAKITLAFRDEEGEKE